MARNLAIWFYDQRQKGGEARLAQLTKKAIINAFLTLLEERPFEKITVRDIVVECGITRNTFYYHFEDVYAVLKELLATHANVHSGEGEQSERLEDCFVEAMRFALEHKRAAYHICCSSRKEELLHCLNAEAGSVIGRFVERRSAGTNADPADKARLIRFFTCALIGLLNEWAEGRMQQDLAYEIRRLGILLEGSLESALSRSAN